MSVSLVFTAVKLNRCELYFQVIPQGYTCPWCLGIPTPIPGVLQLQVNRRPFEPIVDRTNSDSIEPPVVVSGANTSLGTYRSAGGTEQHPETKETRGCPK